MLIHYSQRDAAQFKRMFGVPLSQFWNALGFDVVKFDEEFVHSGINMSVRDAILQSYGVDAVNLVMRIMESERVQIERMIALS